MEVITHTQGTEDRAHGEVGQAARSVETVKTAGFLGYWQCCAANFYARRKRGAQKFLSSVDVPASCIYGPTRVLCVVGVSNFVVFLKNALDEWASELSA
jgi:hypothetical protein